MTDRQFKKGEVIFSEGEMGSTLYQIKEGVVTIYAGYGDSEQQELTKLGRDDIFGEIAVIEACPRSSTAVATEDVTVLEVGCEEVMDYFKTQPAMVMKIMKSLSGRLRELTDDYADASVAVKAISDSVDKEFGGALIERIMRFATEYKRSKAADKLSAEAERILKQSGHADGYSSKVETYDKDTVIFKEGEKGDCMYDIHSGAIGIYDGYGTPGEKLLTRLSANDFFGELGMIDNVERSCTAVVMEKDTILEIIYASDIPELLEKNPDKVRMILEHLSYRLRLLTGEYMNACRLIYRVNEARNKDGIGEGLKSETKGFVDEMLVVRSLKL